MTTRYVKVPVEIHPLTPERREADRYGRLEFARGRFYARMQYDGDCPPETGFGETEDEAFADLLSVLQFEEARSGWTYTARVIDPTTIKPQHKEEAKA